MIELLDKIEMLIYLDFEKNEKFKNAGTTFSSSVIDSEILEKVEEIDKNLAALYKISSGLKVDWDYDLDENLLGRMRILEIESVLKSWEDYFYAEGSDIRIKDFRPVDFFVEEACCGLVLDGSGDQTMYYHDQGDSEIFSLDIDFKSYFELAIDAKIMFGWQRYLVDLINPRNYQISFPERMEKLFPDFDLEAFTAKFESLRLSK